MSQKQYRREDSIVVQQPLRKEQFVYHESCLWKMRVCTCACVCVCIKYARQWSRQKRRCLVILTYQWRNNYSSSCNVFLRCFIFDWQPLNSRVPREHIGAGIIPICLLMDTYFKFTLQTSSLHLPWIHYPIT